MSDELPRKTVKPADPKACIPDPTHPGHDIAPDGTEVVFDSYWIAMLNRGEIVVIDETTPPAAPANPPAA